MHLFGNLVCKGKKSTNLPHLILRFIKLNCRHFLFLVSSSECIGEEPLGLESGLVTNQQMTASSSYNKYHGPSNARLNFAAARGKTGAWSAGTNDQNQWLQVDFLRNVKITKFATQGREECCSQWVTKYKLAYSVYDSSTFQTYQENEVDKVQRMSRVQ